MEIIKTIAVAVGSAVVALGIFLMGQGTAIQDNAQNLSGYLQATPITTATTSAAIAVTSTTRLLASSTVNVADSANIYSRKFASICNPSSTLVYVNLDSDKAAALANGAFTHIIAAAEGYDACLTIHDPSYQGSVTASSTNQTSVTVYVKDYVR